MNRKQKLENQIKEPQSNLFWEIGSFGNGRVRYYQLSFSVSRVKGVTTTIKELFEEDPIRLCSPWELAEDVSESIDKIAISDAHTHVERLIFPCFWVHNKDTGELRLTHRCNNIHGKHTLMTQGGDHAAVYEPRVYVRALRALQGTADVTEMKR